MIIKLAILYTIMIASFIYANKYHNKIYNFLKKSKTQYIEYMQDSSLGVGL